MTALGKCKIALRISFESATLTAYNEENHTFVGATVQALYTITRAPGTFHARYVRTFYNAIHAEATPSTTRGRCWRYIRAAD